MILSMTGYGTASAQKDNIVVSVDIKTVNHRFLDIHLRVAREYQYLEGTLQQLIRSSLERGRVDVNLNIQDASAERFEINGALLRGYLDAADKLKKELGLEDSLDLKTILSLPGIVQLRERRETEQPEVLPELLAESVRSALEGVVRMREHEGKALRADMAKKLAEIEENVCHIRELSANLAPAHLSKLRERMSQLLSNSEIEPQRLAQEAALLADRSDISEEVARLVSHIDQYRYHMDAPERAGKKLDFLLQELQREANTILSKAGDLEISRHALAIKADIERLREQVQNVE